MRIKALRVWMAFALIGIALLSGCEGPVGPAGEDGTSFATVTVPDQEPDIVSAMAGLSEGGTVFVRAQANCYIVSEPIHISKSNTSLIGEQGACIKLADSSNVPVILVGSSLETVPDTDHITNVYISGFIIDGNKENQRDATESDEAIGLPNIRINAIAVRGAEDVWMERLILMNARSGGLVISQQSRNILVQDTIFSGNFFDGLAIDGGHLVLVNNFIAEDNGFSGVSIDTGNSGLLIQNGVIQRNGDNGIFIRFTRESQFKGLNITDNCNLGVFASHDDPGGSEGLVEVTFSELDVFRNLSAGFQYATSEAEGSTNNALTNSRFGGNAGGEIFGGTGLNESGNLIIPMAESGPTNRECL